MQAALDCRATHKSRHIDSPQRWNAPPVYQAAESYEATGVGFL